MWLVFCAQCQYASVSVICQYVSVSVVHQYVSCLLMQDDMQQAAARQGEVEACMHGLTTAAAEATQALQHMQQEQSELAAAAWAAHLASQESALQQERDKYLAEQVLLLRTQYHQGMAVGSFFMHGNECVRDHDH